MNSVACPPVLILAFNRVGKLNELVEVLSQVKPAKVYVTVDGPRAHVPEDVAKTARVREILSNLPWEHELHTLFREENLGCGLAVSGGISWFFENEPEGIILEDDVLPDPSMFGFMGQMLERYRDDERVVHISGSNYSTAHAPDSDYFFSRYVSIWGWASWRRAWQHFDLDISDWRTGPDVLNKPGLNWRTRRYLAFAFGRAVQGLGNWDYQWKYAAMRHGLAIQPNNNLAATTGFGDEATGLHYEEEIPAFVPMPTQLRHPAAVEVIPELDEELFRTQLSRGPRYYEIARILIPSPVVYRRVGLVAKAAARTMRGRAS